MRCSIYHANNAPKQKDKGAAMAILNLGAGLAVFAGPAIVRIFIGPLGDAGVVWILAILYFISAILTRFISLPETKPAMQVAING